MSAARWQRFIDGRWHRRGLTCAGCAALTHDPTTFGWAFWRDASGFLVARCRKCAPITSGRSADSTFGRSVVTTRRRVAEEEN